MAPSVDLQSQDGFTQAAGKKAKKAAKAAAKSKWGDEEDEDGSKKDDGEGSNGGDKDGETGPVLVVMATRKTMAAVMEMARRSQTMIGIVL
jgi:hypothetical protein